MPSKARDHQTATAVRQTAIPVISRPRSIGSQLSYSVPRVSAYIPWRKSIHVEMRDIVG